MRVQSTDADRNYQALFLALDDVLETLSRSFEWSADGFGAQMALLLWWRTCAAGLRAWRRAASSEEVDACESDTTTPRQ